MPTFTITTSPGWAFRVAMPSVAFVLSSSLPSRDNTWMLALPLRPDTAIYPSAVVIIGLAAVSVFSMPVVRVWNLPNPLQGAVVLYASIDSPGT